MCIPIVVSVQITCIGQVPFVKKSHFVKEEEYLTHVTDVSVRKASSGMEKDAPFLTVSEVKFGMEQNVSVQQAGTSTAPSVWSASTVKNGTDKKNPVTVLLVISGRESPARKPMNVVATECGTPSSNIVYVPKENTGTVDNATFSQNVQEDNDGT